MEIFETWPSAYGSAWLVKTYKNRGGTFSGEKTNKGVSKWMQEKWIQVVPYLTKGTIIDCGKNKNTKACRPLYRIDEKTPLTIEELLKIHDEKLLLKIARQKERNMNGRLNWKLGRFYDK